MEQEPKIYKCLDCDGMPLEDQWTLEPTLRTYKYQVKIILITGRERYMHTDEPEAIRVYVKGINARIRWIRKI